MSVFVGVAGALNNLSGTLHDTASISPESVNSRLAKVIEEELINVRLQAKLYMYFARRPAEAPLPNMAPNLRRAVFREVLESLGVNVMSGSAEI
jgi:hypothetical protein